MFSKAQADRILKRAAEIERLEDGRPLSVDDLRSIAEEAGFGRPAVERAIAEAQRLATHPVPAQPVQRSGWVFTRISTSRTIPIELTSEQLMTAIRLFQPYRDGTVQVRLEHDCLTWVDGKRLAFTVWSAGGVTELQVFVSKTVLFRVGRWVRWVKAAADRLEALLLMVAAGSAPATTSLEARRRAALAGPRPE